MTLEHLVIKLFKGNLKKYRLFITCNILTIGILFSLKLLLDNPYLSDPSIVDPMISSNVFAPTFFMYLFAAFFLPFTMVLLNRQIQKNYGVLMAMGLTRTQLYSCVLIENVLIVTISMVSGIMVGNVFEWILLVIITKMVGIGGIYYTQMAVSYLQTAVYLLFVYGITLCGIVFSMKRKNVMKVMTEERETEERKGSRIVFCLGGLLFVLSLLMSLGLYAETAGNILLAGIFFSYVGLIMMISSSSFLIRRWRERHLFLISDYLYYFKRNAIICVMLVGLYGIIVFVTIISAATGNSIKGNVDQYNPYDLVYSQSLKEDKIDIASEVQKYGASIRYEAEVPFFYSSGYAVFGAEDVKKETGTEFYVPEGKYLFVRSNELDDGYVHEAGYVPEQMEIENKKYSLHKDTDELLFCRGGGLTDALILLDQKDYEDAIRRGMETEQVLRLYRLDDAAKVLGLKVDLENRLGRSVSSYCDDYDRAEKSTVLLYLLMGYMATVVLMSVCITFHYKLSLEREKDQSKYHLLTSLGAESKEIQTCMKDKVNSVVLWPLYLTFIWMFLINWINASSIYHVGISIDQCAAVFGILYGIMVLICKSYLRRAQYFA